MFRHLPWLCIVPAVAMAATSLAPPQVTVHGIVHTRSGDRPARLTLICTQGQGGALSLQLSLPYPHIDDFDLDAYEGPGAPAAQKPSAYLQVNDMHMPAAKVGGWYTNDSANGPLVFVFGISDPTGYPGTARSAARALSKPGSTLRWTQDNPHVNGKPLVAEFRPDATETARLARTVAPCMPPKN